ncbi:hypothetical protein NDU88_002595 [Pleurodeles waltl]|uniref:Uncharacterized protein n=1 Tax=Pleurodeles waltl TaxID=8319 RepID=A0AAV7WLX6_PLEWA|nr:hypothetical protein NDU88_002595 [Pleurodeles waltl]
MGVRAPPGHRPEERVQSGAVRLTARDLAAWDGGSLDPILSVHESFLDSRSAMSGFNDEEELDYEEETPRSGDQAVAVPQVTTSGQAVQGDRLSGRRDVAANLCRGEVFRKYDGGLFASVALMDAVTFGLLGTPLCGGRKSKQHPGISGSSWV